jgi:hypothetical protein
VVLLVRTLRLIHVSSPRHQVAERPGGVAGSWPAASTGLTGGVA